MHRGCKLNGVALAMASALGFIAVPAAAADGTLSQSVLGAAQGHAHSGAQHVSEADPWSRRYRRRYRGGHYRRGVDVGDVLTTVLVIGAVATIIDAVDGDDGRRYRDRERDDDYDGDRYREDRSERSRDSDGIDNAVDLCVDQIERGETRVDEVSDARRTADGWRIAGRLTTSESWSCWIDNAGRIREIDFGARDFAAADYASGPALAQVAPGQWSSADYARARAATRTPISDGYVYPEPRQPLAPADYDDPQPTYPGGPLPGAEGSASIDRDLD